MKIFTQTFAGIICFAITIIASAMMMAYLIKSWLQLDIEGRYLFLVLTYVNALIGNLLIIKKIPLMGKNIVVFGALLVVAFIAFLELTVFSRSSSIYQLYYSVALIPMMYVLANYQLNRKVLKAS